MCGVRRVEVDPHPLGSARYWSINFGVWKDRDLVLLAVKQIASEPLVPREMREDGVIKW